MIEMDVLNHFQTKVEMWLAESEAANRETDNFMSHYEVRSRLEKLAHDVSDLIRYLGRREVAP